MWRTITVAAIETFYDAIGERMGRPEIIIKTRHFPLQAIGILYLKSA
jgi:hypothetical protein